MGAAVGREREEGPIYSEDAIVVLGLVFVQSDAAAVEVCRVTVCNDRTGAGAVFCFVSEVSIFL